MLFNSFIFLWFLVIILAVFYAVPRNWSRAVLFVGSYIFYGWWDWRFLGLIVLSTLVDYTVARKISATAVTCIKRRWLLLSIVTNLLLLGVFKYFNFFSQSLVSMFSFWGIHTDITMLDIILPVGISFYTFQTMSYTIDVYRGELEPEYDFLTFATFVSFFPQLVAGPIERAAHLLPQLKERRRIRVDRIPRALWYMLWGYFLKVFMADNLAPIVDAMYANMNSLTCLDVIFCHYVFAFQIFGDFAGYSYIAVGVAELFGVHLMHNFRFPYFVTNPSDFWKNWHISLSRWLRDYLYIPLGGNRCHKRKMYINLMITMLLGGLWHGASWNFVLWGAYQGCILIISHLVINSHSDDVCSIPRGIRVFIMFNITCLGWLFFRAGDLSSVLVMLKNLAEFEQILNWRTFYWIGIACFYISIPLFIHVMQFLKHNDHTVPFTSALGQVYCCTIVIFLLICMGNWGTKSFIYFQF